MVTHLALSFVCYCASTK